MTVSFWYWLLVCIGFLWGIKIMRHHRLRTIIIRFIQLRLICRLICIRLFLLCDAGLLPNKHWLITRELISIVSCFLCWLINGNIKLTLLWASLLPDLFIGPTFYSFFALGWRHNLLNFFKLWYLAQGSIIIL